MLDKEILEMALVGLEKRRQDIEQKIEEIKALLNGKRVRGVASEHAPAAPRKRKMSAAGKKRIAEAARRRWQAFHAQQAKATKAQKTTKPAVKKGSVKAAPKRKMSPAAKAKLVQNLAKARAARAAKRSAGEPVPF